MNNERQKAASVKLGGNDIVFRGKKRKIIKIQNGKRPQPFKILL